MNAHSESKLEALGRAAAEQVAGDEAVAEVEVERGEDGSERPVVYFSFLIEQDRTQQRAGLIRTRLVQKLRDDMVAGGYGELPVVRVLSREDWNKRSNAGSV
jgi:hypothetical protein